MKTTPILTIVRGCQTVPARFEQMIGRIDRKGQVTPLARAALDNGVSFDDVRAYVEAYGGKGYALDWYEALIMGPEVPAGSITEALQAHCTAMAADTALEGALQRSAQAQAEGRIAGSAVFWRGVL